MATEVEDHSCDIELKIPKFNKSWLGTYGIPDPKMHADNDRIIGTFNDTVNKSNHFSPRTNNTVFNSVYDEYLNEQKYNKNIKTDTEDVERLYENAENYTNDIGDSLFGADFASIVDQFSNEPRMKSISEFFNCQLDIGDMLIQAGLLVGREFLPKGVLYPTYEAKPATTRGIAINKVKEYLDNIIILVNNRVLRNSTNTNDKTLNLCTQTKYNQAQKIETKNIINSFKSLLQDTNIFERLYDGYVVGSADDGYISILTLKRVFRNHEIIRFLTQYEINTFMSSITNVNVYKDIVVVDHQVKDIFNPEGAKLSEKVQYRVETTDQRIKNAYSNIFDSHRYRTYRIERKVPEDGKFIRDITDILNKISGLNKEILAKPPVVDAVIGLSNSIGDAYLSIEKIMNVLDCCMENQEDKDTYSGRRTSFAREIFWHVLDMIESIFGNHVIFVYLEFMTWLKGILCLVYPMKGNPWVFLPKFFDVIYSIVENVYKAIEWITDTIAAFIKLITEYVKWFNSGVTNCVGKTSGSAPMRSSKAEFKRAMSNYNPQEYAELLRNYRDKVRQAHEDRIKELTNANKTNRNVTSKPDDAKKCIKKDIPLTHTTIEAAPLFALLSLKDLVEDAADSKCSCLAEMLSFGNVKNTPIPCSCDLVCDVVKKFIVDVITYLQELVSQIVLIVSKILIGPQISYIIELVKQKLMCIFGTWDTLYKLGAIPKYVIAPNTDEHNNFLLPDFKMINATISGTTIEDIYNPYNTSGKYIDRYFSTEGEIINAIRRVKNSLRDLNIGSVCESYSYNDDIENVDETPYEDNSKEAQGRLSNAGASDMNLCVLVEGEPIFVNTQDQDSGNDTSGTTLQNAISNSTPTNVCSTPPTSEDYMVQV